MSLKRFESFLRRLSRVLYEDDLTPSIIDFLLKNQIAEPVSLSVFFRLQNIDTSPSKLINALLQ
jgi:hypothetical protein